jgi:hypothetical protein
VIRSLVVLAACSSSNETPPSAPPIHDAAAATSPSRDAAIVVAIDAKPVDPEVWLRGSTHVHAKPSGDSTTPIPTVIAWYESHDYDFIVLTDHNQVSEVDTSIDTSGKPWVRFPERGLIVIAGIEFTENPTGCLPAGDASRKCRIHVNMLGSTARPRAKLKDWIARDTDQRVAKYQAALTRGKSVGGIAQVNHPQWFWGMTTDTLVEIARRGVVLFEIANVQFAKWNKGDKEHLSTDALWDEALMRGATLWGVATDDAHHYDGGGKYPAGGAWVVVKARRDPQAIVDALAAGRFYASTGVTLSRVDVSGGELVVEIAANDAARSIDFYENGKRVATVEAKIARRALPASGYLRAVAVRADGARAWTQPARR